MDRTDNFILMFNQISDHLSQLANIDRHEPFYHVVDLAAQKNPAVQREAAQLKKYGDLRNAIVHDSAYPGEKFAEPTDATLAKFAGILNRIISPKQLFPAFQREMRCFAPNEPLVAALAYMRENGFSQVVVQQNGTLSLLTVEGVAGWLAAKAKEDIISIAEAKIGDALAFDIPDAFRVMGRSETVSHVQEAFAKAIDHKKPRLLAVIVTQNGKPNEKPLGIVTPWDLLEEPPQG